MSRALVARLRAAGCVFAEEEAGLLLEAASSPDELEDMVSRRERGLPLEQVVGHAEFCGLRVYVDPGVFVPRRRTEHLARQAVELARARRVPVGVDLCCGSGCVAAVVAREIEPLELYASDVEPAAVACARRNLEASGRVVAGDLFEGLPEEISGRVDVLVANVPYVPTAEIGLMPAEARLHEPAVALDGGGDGLDVLRRVAAQAPRWLAPGGSLLVETSERQAGTAVGVLAGQGLQARVSRDADLGATVVIGAKGPQKRLDP